MRFSSLNFLIYSLLHDSECELRIGRHFTGDEHVTCNAQPLDRNIDWRCTTPTDFFPRVERAQSTVEQYPARIDPAMLQDADYENTKGILSMLGLTGVPVVFDFALFVLELERIDVATRRSVGDRPTSMVSRRIS